MSAWGSAAKSCDSLLTRIEANDPTLTELCILPSKSLTDDDVERLARCIESGGNNTHLESISASGHAVSPAALQTLGSAIASRGAHKHSRGGITSLSIGSKEMGDVGIVALCSGLSAGPSDGPGSLQCVDLSHKSATHVGFAAIGKCFGASSALRSLNLSRNGGCGAGGAVALMIGNAQHFRNLTYLNLADCGMGRDGVQALVSGLTRHGQQRNDESARLDLILSDNPIGEDGCSNLEPLVPILKSLSLVNCNIDDDGVFVLLEAIHGRSSEAEYYSDDEGPNKDRRIGLTMLDLSRNDIHAAGGDSIGDSLNPDHAKSGGLPSLKELHLAGCPIATNDRDYVEGVQDLTRFLDKGDGNGGNNTLKALNLSDTGCTAKGAAAALECAALTSLRLFGNRIGSEGFLSITPLLRGGHSSLVNLDLGGNDAGEDAVAGLLRAIMEPNGGFENALRVLEIGGNEVGSTVESILEDLTAIRPDLDVARDRPKGELEQQQQQLGL